MGQPSKYSYLSYSYDKERILGDTLLRFYQRFWSMIFSSVVINTIYISYKISFAFEFLSIRFHP